MKISKIISLRFPSSNESNSLSSSSSFVISIYILLGLYSIFSLCSNKVLSGLFDLILLGLIDSKKSGGNPKWVLYILILFINIIFYSFELEDLIWFNDLNPK